MPSHREKIVEVIRNLIETRDIIFTQIINLAMDGEMNHLKDAFDVGDVYSFSLKHFEDVEDINVKKLVKLCKNVEETIFTIMDLNGISENEVEFRL